MPRDTPKTHFSGFNFTLLARRQLTECDAEVANQVVRLPGFYYYIVYVRLNGPPDVVSEDVLHTPLVCCACVSEAERHRDVAVHPERRDE
jgi:hypothetical protein